MDGCEGTQERDQAPAVLDAAARLTATIGCGAGCGRPPTVRTAAREVPIVAASRSTARSCTVLDRLRLLVGRGAAGEQQDGHAEQNLAEPMDGERLEG